MTDPQASAQPIDWPGGEAGGRGAAAEGGKPSGKMSYERFLAWADEDTRAEWVDGEVIVHSPASNRHQDVADFLTSVVRIYAETQRLGWVRSAPFQMKLERSGREPDLMFVAREHEGRIQQAYLDGPADLAVEVVSPDSAARDRGEKFYEYEAAGVREYWLIDPDRQQAEFYQLADDGRYRLVSADDRGRYHSAVLSGFWLQVDWLWSDPLPPVLDVLGQLGLLDHPAS